MNRKCSGPVPVACTLFRNAAFVALCTAVELVLIVVENMSLFTKLLIQQGRQCTYNVILRRVRDSIVTVEKQYILHILSVSL